MLTLPIKRKYFDMILSGEKLEEYREIKKYYITRFATLGVGSGDIHTIRFRNGYSKSSPTIECKVTISQDTGKEEWGAEPGKVYFVLKILEVKLVLDILEEKDISLCDKEDTEVIGEVKSDEETEEMQRIFASAAYQNKTILRNHKTEKRGRGLDE